MNDFKMARDARKKPDIYKLFYHEDETLSNNSFEEEPLSSSQRLALILGRPVEEFTSHHRDDTESHLNTKRLHNNNDTFSNDFSLIQDNRKIQEQDLPIMKCNNGDRDDKFLFRKQYLDENMSQLQTNAVVLPKTILDTLNLDKKYELSKNNNDLLKENSLDAKLADNYYASCDNSFSNIKFKLSNTADDSKRPILKRLENRLKGRLGLTKNTELDIFYCNANRSDASLKQFSDEEDANDYFSVRDVLELSVTDSGINADEDNYESELTDLEDWRHLAHRGSNQKFKRVTKCIIENRKITLLILILSLLAVALLIALISIITKK